VIEYDKGADGQMGYASCSCADSAEMLTLLELMLASAAATLARYVARYRGLVEFAASRFDLVPIW